MSKLISNKILKSVSKPTRYIGNEWNSVHKDLNKVDVRMALCFPDVYEVGMSHLGIKILYHLLNRENDVYCERVFSPWVDMEEKMIENNIPLFTMETHTPINEIDILGFTLQYEMSYTNIINALNLGEIPLMSVDRTEEHPFVIAGGPCAYNPEPIADFFDFFVIGEGEEIILEVVNEYKAWKKNKESRDAFLKRVAKLQGIYVPKFYNVEYNEDGTIKSFEPISDEFPKKIKKRIILDMDKVFYPEEFVVPYMEIVHDRTMLELFRGCIRGCRFCQAGMVYRPVREKSVDRLTELSDKLQESTGYEEMSLSSLSTSDYRDLERLGEELLKTTEDKKVNLSLPSLRVDNFSLKLMKKAQKVRKSSLTFAPEAGTQRLRDVINKGVIEEDLENSVSIAFNNGYSSVKLYFMVGLPTETIEDVEGIAHLGHKVVDKYFEVPKEQRAKGLNITVSTACFVPKPFTPFQWEPQDSIENFNEKQKHLREKIKNRNITYNWHDPKLSFLEAIFALGDRRLSKVLVKAVDKGCRFDGWTDHFKYEAWLEAFEEEGVDPHFFANRKKALDEVLPWDFIDIGVSKKFMVSENKKAHEGVITPNCRTNCSGCGSTVFGGGVCFEKVSG